MSVDLHTKVMIKALNDSNAVKLNLNGKTSIEWSIQSLIDLKLSEVNQKPKTVIEFNDSLAERLSKLEDKTFSKDVIDSCSAFLFLYLGISDSFINSKRIPLEISVSSDLPIGAGLGSSSSYTVGLTAALFKVFGLCPELSVISEWAFQIDKLFHGRPSGIDNSICTFGGALLFRSGKIVEHLPEVQSLPVILVNTKVPRNTRAMVERVRHKYNKYTEIVENILSAIDGISVNGWKLIQQQKDFQDFEVVFKSCLTFERNSY